MGNIAKKNFEEDSTKNQIDMWKSKKEYLQKEYNIEIPSNEIDESYEVAKKKKRKYKFNDNKSNYISLDEDGISYISLLNGFDWPLKNDPRFWQLKDEPQEYSYTKEKVWHLGYNSWVDLSFSFLHVKKGNYKLFIHDGGRAEHRFLRIKDHFNLSIYLNDKKIMFVPHYPTKEIVDKYKKDSNQLYENLIGYISEEQFENLKPDEHGDYIVTVKLLHNNMKHKGGWFIDGGRLLSVNQELITNVKNKNKNKDYPLLEIENNDYSNEVNLFNHDLLKIERKSSTGVLNSNVLSIIFSYCNEKDLLNLMTVNVCVRNISIEIFKKSERLEKVLDIVPNNIYSSLYKYPNTINENYLAFDANGNKSYIAMPYFIKEKPENFEQVECNESYYGKKSFYLHEMCWIEVYMNFFKTKKGNYKLFIHEFIPKDSSIIGKFYLSVWINEKLIVDCPFPPNEFKSNSDGKLKEDFICFIKENDFDGLIPNLKNNYVVRIEFWHQELYWKRRWLIDGARLVEIKDPKEITESGLKSFENKPNYKWRSA